MKSIRQTWQRIKSLRKDEEGAALAVVAITLSLILGMAAVVVDLGSQYRNKMALQEAVDNAVFAAGSMLPCELCAADDVEGIVEKYLDANGYDPDELKISYEWTKGTGCYYALRVSAEYKVKFSFAGVFNTDSANVTATAKITSRPVSQTLKAISIYIEKASFESQLSSVSAGTEFKITLTSSGASSTGKGNLGIMRIVPNGEESTYITYDGWSRSQKGDPIFFEKGYWRWVNGSKCGISVGEQRSIENSPQIYSNAYEGISARISACNSSCRSGCSWSSHSYECPRIALLPVVTTSSAKYNNEKDSNGTATIEYFVAIYIKNVTKSGTSTVITCCYLDDYRETSDVDTEAEVTLNPYMVCSTYLEE